MDRLRAGVPSFFVVAIFLWETHFVQSQHFRSGSLQWKQLEDNTVGFLFAATFKRSYGGFSGTGEQGFPGHGDQVTLSGREPILFYPGLSPNERGRPIVIDVTAIDVVHDTFQGFWTTEVSFPAPSAHGSPWRSRVAGCCRFSALQHAANTHFEVTAAVNLDLELVGSSVDMSGSIGAVATLHVLPGHAETRFPIMHELLPSFVSCMTRDAQECLAAARLMRCDLDTLLYPVDGVDCSPYLDTCLRPLCNQEEDDDEEVEAEEKTGASELTAADRLGVFVRQVQAEEGGSGAQDAESCFMVFERGGAAACVRHAGCCWEEASGLCGPCIAVSAQGALTTSAFTPPGLYPLSLALSALPEPDDAACVDTMLDWRATAGGRRCSELASVGMCGANGTAGALGWEVCCDCGGGRYHGGTPDPMTGIEGEYRSTDCANVSSSFSAASPSPSPSSDRVFWNASLVISSAFDAVWTYSAYATPPINHTLLPRNSTAPCSANVVLFTAEFQGPSSVDHADAVIDHQGPKRVWLNAERRRVHVQSAPGELVVAQECGCLGLNGTEIAAEQQRMGESYAWVEEYALDACTAATCDLLRTLGLSDSGRLGFEYRGGGGWPTRGACDAELGISGQERRVCGWQGIERGQCERLGCCWSEKRGAPFCSARTYRDLNASVVHLKCDASDQGCRNLSLAADVVTMPRGGEASSRPTALPPAAITSTELVLVVEDDDQLQLHIAELGGPHLAPLNLTLLHAHTGRRSAALEAFTELESRYRLRFSPSPWRVYTGGHPGSVHYIITHADVPSTSTPSPDPDPAPPSSDASDGEEPALSEVRLEWSFSPGQGELFTELLCMQARLLVSCSDVSSGWQDERGRNCSTLHSLSLCPGLMYTSPAQPPLTPPTSPIRPLTSAREACCACGGGHIATLWTEMVCLPSTPKPEPPPKLFLASQMVLLRPPCDTFLLGDPPAPVRHCSTPVVSPPCRPPFSFCVDEFEGVAMTFPRRIREDTAIGEVAHIIIRNGGLGCQGTGFLGADPSTPFGHGFSASFEIAEAGTFRGTSGGITSVTIVQAGSGYRIPPAIVISSGGQGCADYAFEAVLSDRQYQILPVYPGVGLDMEVIVGDVSFQEVNAVSFAPGGLERMPLAQVHPAVRAPGWASRRVVWVPGRPSAGENPFPLCLEASDRGAEANKTVSACLALHVVRCQYAIREGETLLHVAAFYATNWIQVWAMNPELVDPDGELEHGQVVGVGHIHRVGQGEVLDWLIRKFGLSYTQVFSLNGDLAQKDLGVLGEGQELCLIPAACNSNL